MSDMESYQTLAGRQPSSEMRRRSIVSLGSCKAGDRWQGNERGLSEQVVSAGI